MTKFQPYIEEMHIPGPAAKGSPDAKAAELRALCKIVENAFAPLENNSPIAMMWRANQEGVE
jgi:hypothetical protein